MGFPPLSASNKDAVAAILAVTAEGVGRWPTPPPPTKPDAVVALAVLTSLRARSSRYSSVGRRVHRPNRTASSPRSRWNRPMDRKARSRKNADTTSWAVPLSNRSATDTVLPRGGKALQCTTDERGDDDRREVAPPVRGLAYLEYPLGLEGGLPPANRSGE